MPWQGHTDNMIDRYVYFTYIILRKEGLIICRFDVRAMLDYIPPYDPKIARPLSEEDKELEADLNYSRYKELVDHSRTGGNVYSFV